ncbi:BTB/POZ domain-containing protein 9-like [Adelges cooleyi]|uniref:BTB/POZ domain-containing protein 9-like n=1 Tax=Adelges cooleyi TaxID=133065 RepID=UPI00217FA67E|nr:BTB/POZ domain-containing protein 9-like [Adelges cooleyi]
MDITKEEVSTRLDHLEFINTELEKENLVLKKKVLELRQMINNIHEELKQNINDADTSIILEKAKRESEIKLLKDEIETLKTKTVEGTTPKSGGLLQAYSGRTENLSSSANPAGDEQIDHTHFLTDECRRFDSNQFLNEECSDVVLVVDIKRFPAHRAVLASRSDYFSGLLRSGYEEAHKKVVTINEGSPTSIKELLKYIYFGKMNLRVLESNVILELLILSNIWRFTNLQFSLSEYLCNHINVDSVSALFVVAFYYQLKELEVASINFIEIHALDVLQSEDSQSLSAEALVLILSRNTAYANELNIFRAVCQWIKKNQDHLHPGDKTKILSAVRYQLMNIEELSEVRRSELVCSDTIILDVIKKSLTQTLNDRGRLVPNVNFAQEDSIELSQIDGGTMIMLDHPVNINYIEMDLCYWMLLWDHHNDTYGYNVLVSVNRKDWVMIIDKSNKPCQSWQLLQFEQRLVAYIRITGVHSSDTDETFNLKYLEAPAQVSLAFIIKKPWKSVSWLLNRK